MNSDKPNHKQLFRIMLFKFIWFTFYQTNDLRGFSVLLFIMKYLFVYITRPNY